MNEEQTPFLEQFCAWLAELAGLTVQQVQENLDVRLPLVEPRLLAFAGQMIARLSVPHQWGDTLRDFSTMLYVKCMTYDFREVTVRGGVGFTVADLTQDDWNEVERYFGGSCAEVKVGVIEAIVRRKCRELMAVELEKSMCPYGGFGTGTTPDNL